MGLDDLVGRRTLRRRGVVLAIALGLLVLPVLVLAGRGQLSGAQLGGALEIASGLSWPAPPADADETTAIRMGALIVWLAFMGLSAALLAARVHRRLPATVFAVLALALVAADLFKAGMGATPAITTDAATQPLDRGARLPALPAPEPLRRARPRDRPLPLVANTALRLELFDARSYDLPVERRYDRLWRRAVVVGEPGDFPTTSAVLTDRSLRAFSLLSVTDIAQDPAERRAQSAAGGRLRQARPARLCKPRALPRAVAGAQRVVRSEEALARCGAQPELRREPHRDHPWSRYPAWGRTPAGSRRAALASWPTSPSAWS